MPTTPTSGNDTVTGTSGNDTINLLAGGNDIAYGGDGNDRIMSDGGDTLVGGSGTDTLDLRLSNSTISYVIDMAEVAASSGNTYVHIGDFVNDPSQLLVQSFETLFFYGGSGNDSIKGGVNADIINGGGGHDTIYGGGGNDLLYGHNGNTSIFGGTGADTITIDGYVDSIDGSNGQINGDQTTSFNTHGYGDDDVLRITGTAGFLTGADGVANRVGQIHNIEHIYVNGGLNVSFSRDTSPNTIDHYQQGGTTGVDTYGHQVYVTDVSDGHGGFLGASLTGSQYGDTLSGGKGADSLVGATGNDTLYGGDGNDTLQGGVGGDHIFGGAGDDTVLIYSGTNQQPDATVSGGDGVDTLFYNATQFATATTIDITQAVTTPGLTSISGFEILNYQASNNGDTVHAGALNDTLWGGSGNDFIFAGTDSHAGTGLGSTFNDIVDGMGGQDTVGFLGQSSDFTFQHDGAFVLATNTVTNEHVDLKNVEYVSFSNGADTHLLSDYIV